MIQCFLHSIALPIGKFLLVESEGFLCAMTTESELPFLHKQLQRHISETLIFVSTTTPLLQQAEQQLAEYFRSQRRIFDLPIRLYGSEFQQRVWQQLLQIPYGCTTNYGSIANQLHQKGSRAVGTAVGKNPLPIIVPCHRVLPADGSLGNFSMYGGSATKAFLLDLEGVSYK